MVQFRVCNMGAGAVQGGQIQGRTQMRMQGWGVAYQCASVETGAVTANAMKGCKVRGRVQGAGAGARCGSGCEVREQVRSAGAGERAPGGARVVQAYGG